MLSTKLLGVKLPSDIAQWPYEKIRIYLILHSHRFIKIIRQLKNTSKIKGKTQLKKEIAYLAGKQRRQLQEIANILRIPTELLEDKLIYDFTNEQLAERHFLPIYTTSADNPIVEDGHYIKVSSFTRLDTVKTAYKQIKQDLQELSTILPKDDNTQARLKVIQRDKPLDNKKMKIACFIRIQATLQDMPSPHVNHAIEFVAEVARNKNTHKKGNVKADLNQYVGQITNIYYSLISYYSLPSEEDYLLVTDPL